MKDIKVKDCKKNFTPVKVEFVIETEEELLALWHKLNASSATLDNYYKKYSFKKVDVSLFDFWYAIDKIRMERNIDPYAF